MLKIIIATLIATVALQAQAQQAPAQGLPPGMEATPSQMQALMEAQHLSNVVMVTCANKSFLAERISEDTLADALKNKAEWVAQWNASPAIVEKAYQVMTAGADSVQNKENYPTFQKALSACTTLKKMEPLLARMNTCVDENDQPVKIRETGSACEKFMNTVLQMAPAPKEEKEPARKWDI